MEALQTYYTCQTDIEQYSIQIELAKFRRDRWKKESRHPLFAGEPKHDTLKRLQRAVQSNITRADQIIGRYRAPFGPSYGTSDTVDILPTSEPQQEGSIGLPSRKIRVIGFSKTLRWIVWDSRELRHLSETVMPNVTTSLITLLTDP